MKTLTDVFSKPIRRPKPKTIKVTIRTKGTKR